MPRRNIASDSRPALIELVCMRMCGHAHHDDMLYLGKEPPIGWSYPPLLESGYADRELYEFWSERDPIPDSDDSPDNLMFYSELGGTDLSPGQREILTRSGVLR